MFDFEEWWRIRYLADFGSISERVIFTAFSIASLFFLTGISSV
jgi:hypothetical protein